MTTDEAARDFPPPKKKNRKRRADGSLRPTVRRRRWRQRQKRNAELEASMTEQERADRAAWLANFEPGARAKFFSVTREGERVWLRAFAAELNLPQEKAAPLMERTADERNWIKLQTKDGMCVGIAPFRPFDRKKKKSKPRPDYDPRIDHPERYSDGPY